MNDQALTPDWIMALAPLLLVAFWMVVVGLIAHLSGWQRLAQHYRATLPPYGKRWAWQNGRFGWADYSGILTFTANPQGLFIEVFVLFGIGHPRLFIPWHVMRDVERKDFLWQHQVQVKVGFPPLATLLLPAAVFEGSEGRHLLADRMP